jgi:hypothetical protein
VVRPATTSTAASPNGESSASSQRGSGQQSPSPNATTSAVVASKPAFFAS